MMKQVAPSDVRPISVAVWDPLIRFGHWALVAAFAVAYLSAEEESGSPDALHVWGGYVVGAIVVVRVLWGLVGPKHARFSDFVRGPMAAVRYLVDLGSGRASRYLGHSPAGGAMVLALLACLAGTVITGVMAYGEKGKGPLAGETSTIAMLASANPAYAEENTSSVGVAERERPEGEESFVGELHGALANITLALVLLHVLGVGVASYAHRENLVAAMVTGRKRAA
jgi:cytochrome b